MDKQLIALNLNLSLVDKARLYKGKKGQYLSAVLHLSPTTDQYGNHGFVVESITKEERQNGQRGTKSPPLQTVERIARALNVRVEYLQHGTGDVDADPMARHATLSEHPQWPALAADAARVAPELERWIEEAGSMSVGRSGQPKRIDVRYILDIASALQRAHERQTA